jgi:ankyrin repeat protein
MGPVQAQFIEYAPRTPRWHESPAVRQAVRAVVLALVLIGLIGGTRYGYHRYQAARLERQRRLNRDLYDAASRGDEQQVRRFLAEGANPNGDNSQVSTALDGFISGDRISDSTVIPRVLIEAGVDVNRGSPLNWALFVRKEEVALFLIESGANVNVRSPYGRHGPGGVTPLHRAYSNPRLVRALISHGADLEARTGIGETPLFWALQGCGGRFIDRMIAAGEDAPSVAKPRESLQCVRELIRAGADVNDKDIRGVMPLNLVQLKQSEVKELGRFPEDAQWMFFPRDHREERLEAARLLKEAGARDE